MAAKRGLTTARAASEGDEVCQPQFSNQLDLCRGVRYTDQGLQKSGKLGIAANYNLHTPPAWTLSLLSDLGRREMAPV